MRGMTTGTSGGILLALFYAIFADVSIPLQRKKSPRLAAKPKQGEFSVSISANLILDFQVIVSVVRNIIFFL